MVIVCSDDLLPLSPLPLSYPWLVGPKQLPRMVGQPRPLYSTVEFICSVQQWRKEESRNTFQFGKYIKWRCNRAENSENFLRRNPFFPLPLSFLGYPADWMEERWIKCTFSVSLRSQNSLWYVSRIQRQADDAQWMHPPTVKAPVPIARKKKASFKQES